MTTTAKTPTSWLVNPGTSPAVYTDEGHILGAGDRVKIGKDGLDATGTDAVANDVLAVQTPADGEA